jgi:hypothetical protein
MVRILIYPIGGGLPVTVDVEGPDSLTDALVLDLRPTDAENVLKGGATEYSFDCPQTPSNRAIFDDWQHYQRDAGTAYLYRDAVLEVDGFPARLGKIALMSATDEIARCTMFFDSEDPFRNLQDLRVNQLDWDVVSDTGIANLASGAGYFTAGSNVVTIPAKLRSWPVNGNGDRVVTNADFYPCISVKSLFYQAFQRTTPTAPASIDYLSQWTNNTVFENLVIFLNKNRGYDKAYVQNLLGVRSGASAFVGTFLAVAFPTPVYTFSAMDYVDDVSSPGFFDNGSNYAVSPGVSRYTAPIKGNYIFDVTFTVGPSMPTGGVFPFTGGFIQLRYSINGLVQYTAQSTNLPNGQITVITSRQSYLLDVGDYVDFETSFSVIGGAANESGDIESVVLSVTMASDSYSAGNTALITGALVSSDLTVADVFRDVFRMFNLRMFWDNVRQTMAIGPARRWYNQLNGATYSGFMAKAETDWTDRVVEPPQEVIVERWAWDYWLTYGEPQDAWLKAQSALSEVPSAGGRIDTGREGAQRNLTEMEGKPMAHIFDATVSDPLYPSVMLPMLLREDHTTDPIGQTTFNTDDSLFYLMVSPPTAFASEFGFVRTYNIPTTITAFTGCARGSQIPYDYNTNQNTFVRPSLGFGDETSVNGNAIPGLISNYHFGTIASANNGKYMKAQIRLSSVDLQTYTFDRPIRIASRLFEVLRINGKPAESDVYEVELRTIDYPDAAALQWLQNPNSPSYLTYDADPE